MRSKNGGLWQGLIGLMLLCVGVFVFTVDARMNSSHIAGKLTEQAASGAFVSVLFVIAGIYLAPRPRVRIPEWCLHPTDPMSIVVPSLMWIVANLDVFGMCCGMYAPVAHVTIGIVLVASSIWAVYGLHRAYDLDAGYAPHPSLVEKHEYWVKFWKEVKAGVWDDDDDDYSSRPTMIKGGE